MDKKMELFTLNGGVYPLRITIYLAEKKLTHLIKITPCTHNGICTVAPGKPPGTVPILSFGDGTYIKQSIAILQFFEDVCSITPESADWNTLTNTEKSIAEAGREVGSLRGDTVREKARNREIIAIVDEAMIQFGVAMHKGSMIFESMEEQHATASKFGMEACKKQLVLLDGYYGTWNVAREEKVSVADCVLFALLQFAWEFYGVGLWKGLPGLERFYEAFKLRDSARIPGDGLWENKAMMMMARKFLEGCGEW